MHLGVPQDVEQQRIHFRLGAFARIAQEVVELVQGIAAVGAVGPVGDGKGLVRIDVHQAQGAWAGGVERRRRGQKNDAADAEAICEAAQRPTMRFVAVKSEEQQASVVVFRARDLLVQQRTQTINALRGHLAEYGLVVSKGPSHIAKLIAQVEDPQSSLPQAARLALSVLVETLRSLEHSIKRLDVEIARRAREDGTARRLATIPGIGPITATALVALSPAPASFKRGRDFAAWLGLTPLQRSTGGKQKLGAISKMGERTLRRLLIIGASAVTRQARRRGAPQGSWLARMFARKPPMLVIVALANKMARIVWALLAKGGVYQAPAAVA